LPKTATVAEFGYRLHGFMTQSFKNTTETGAHSRFGLSQIQKECVKTAYHQNSALSSRGSLYSAPQTFWGDKAGKSEEREKTEVIEKGKRKEGGFAPRIYNARSSIGL